jgi:DNA sulfur modification protein DndE
MMQQTPSVDTVRLGSDTKIHLSTLKKRTGIENWNTLCRWSFCLSVSDEAPVRERDERGLGAVEMTWKTFAGEDEDIYRALLLERCRSEHGSVDKDLLALTLRQHIARGAARLVSNRRLKSVGHLLELATVATE